MASLLVLVPFAGQGLAGRMATEQSMPSFCSLRPEPTQGSRLECLEASSMGEAPELSRPSPNCCLPALSNSSSSRSTRSPKCSGGKIRCRFSLMSLVSSREFMSNDGRPPTEPLPPVAPFELLAELNRRGHIELRTRRDALEGGRLGALRLPKSSVDRIGLRMGRAPAGPKRPICKGHSSSPPMKDGSLAEGPPPSCS
eukprot:scaffold112868_cov31-Tisochrysis_lutea.AAC.4